MTDPWKPIEEMGHDEIRRYVSELIWRWTKHGGDHGELSALIEAVSKRMEEIGVPVPPILPSLQGKEAP